MTLDYLQLLDSDPIYIDGIGHIIPPTIRSIKKIGLKAYYSKLNILQISVQDILNDEILQLLPEIDKSQLNVFDALYLDDSLMQLLIDSLSFFMSERIISNKSNQMLLCYDKATNKAVGKIYRDNFNDLCSLILQLNFLETKSCKKLRPKNKEAERILKKLQNAPQKQSEEKSLSIGEMVAAICSNIDTYKYSDIWSLTVYQLYDLFFRLKLRKEIDVLSQRWAAWGTEPFDFDLWCKNIRN